ncbi:LysR family transcriptional regulator [Aggregatibacter kilianii]|uniref:LysR family transcriptional regulator n=1 Tax=Aggregatibacter kilianii TaxID=2025884 RepID=UPI000D6568FE|nr:LysR family transcriptional regulator [Aggregatibacter kilianii]
MQELRQLDLNLLKALVVLLDEQNVSRAAEKMALSQSAMSAILAKLRDSFGDPLFIRTQYGLSPTERAKALHAPLKQVLADINQLWQPPEFDPAKAEMTVKIGLTDYGFHAVGLPFLRKIRPLAPKIKLAFLPILGGDVSQRLNKGELDFALITQGETLPDFHTKALFDEHYLCAMRQDHPLKVRLNLDEFCTADHAMVSYHGGQFHGLVDDELTKLGRSRHVAVSVSSFLALPELLAHSDFIATAPARLLQHRPELFVCEPPLAIAGFTKLLAWHERTHHSEAFKWLREKMAEAVG